MLFISFLSRKIRLIMHMHVRTHTGTQSTILDSIKCSPSSLLKSFGLSLSLYSAPTLCAIWWPLQQWLYQQVSINILKTLFLLLLLHNKVIFNLIMVIDILLLLWNILFFCPITLLFIMFCFIFFTLRSLLPLCSGRAHRDRDCCRKFGSIFPHR